MTRLRPSPNLLLSKPPRSAADETTRLTHTETAPQWRMKCISAQSHSGSGSGSGDVVYILSAAACNMGIFKEHMAACRWENRLCRNLNKPGATAREAINCLCRQRHTRPDTHVTHKRQLLCLAFDCDGLAMLKLGHREEKGKWRDRCECVFVCQGKERERG